LQCITAVCHGAFEEGGLRYKPVVCADRKESTLEKDPNVLHGNVFATKEEVASTVHE
jgi:hypothetical protein